MPKILIKFFTAFALIFALDQTIKMLFISGFTWEGEYFSLVLTYNEGVAFSMFAFLGKWLKFIQLALIAAVFLYLILEKRLLNAHATALGVLLGAGSSNIIDRFIHGGVVDYVFWHKWFNFAVFNFADVMIDLAVVLILWQSFFASSKD